MHIQKIKCSVENEMIANAQFGLISNNSTVDATFLLNNIKYTFDQAMYMFNSIQKYIAWTYNYLFANIHKNTMTYEYVHRTTRIARSIELLRFGNKILYSTIHALVK